MIEKTLKVLLLEDLPTDQELIKRQVKKMAPNAVFTISANREEFLDRLRWVSPDLILADYRLPDFNGLEALLHVKETMPHVPFIFITGTLNDEEKAAEAILRGASGYILKENLQTMPDKLRTILDESHTRYAEEEKHRQEQRQKQIALQKLQALLEASSTFPQKKEMQALLNDVLGESLQMGSDNQDNTFPHGSA